MRTIRHGGEYELDVRRSRFICALARVADEDAARAFIARRRGLHWNATHNCTAYVVGERGQTQRSSDDGEPAGTAGVPMLEVLRHRGLTDTVAVVTRYFGGVKLGAGGLVRAYGSAVSAAVDHVGVVERRSLPVVAVLADHQRAGRLESALRRSRHRILDVRYAADVHLDVAVEGMDAAGFAAWVAELSAGQAVCEQRGYTTVDVELGAD